MATSPKPRGRLSVTSVVLDSPRFPTASGRPAVRGAYEAVFANIRIAIHFTVDELTVQGDVAYARTHSVGTATVVATGASGPEQNRELFVFARGSGGWKIARYMFNKAS